MPKNKKLLNEIKSKIKNVIIYQNIEFDDFSLKVKNQRNSPNLRLELFDNIDLKNKTVYDLGCSNGFFCYELAKRGAKVIGVDKNKKTIELNRLIAKYYDLDIEFIEDDLLDESFYNERMGNSDLVIFLSVIHHIYKNTEKYPSNYCNKILKIISEKTDKMIFETGQSGEPFHWSIKLGEMGLNPQKWILDNWLWNTNFKQKDVIKSLLFRGRMGAIREKVCTLYRKSIYKPYHPLRYYFINLICRLFIRDPRETRYIFICSK